MSDTTNYTDEQEIVDQKAIELQRISVMTVIRLSDVSCLHI